MSFFHGVISFYGTNLIVLCGEDGEMYYTDWDDEDIEIISTVLKDGIRVLEKTLNIDLNKCL